MRFVQTIDLPVAADAAWRFLMDVPRVATCVPGAGPVVALGDDAYRGDLSVRVGPIGLKLAGQVRIVDRDPDARVATMRLEAADGRIGGAVDAQLTMALEALDDPAPKTRMTVTTDARIIGRIGDFGQPIIKRKADQILREFGANIAAALAADARD